MSRKPPIDEVRTARALKRLEEHRAAHPEAFAPDRLPTTPTALAAALGERRKVGWPPATEGVDRGAAAAIGAGRARQDPR